MNDLTFCVDPGEILGVLYFVLGYLLFAILSVTVGGISSNASEAQILAMFYIMMLFVPIWFAGLMINFPNNSIWDVLSIFPFTAPIQIMLRLSVSDVPAWQIVTSIGVLGLSIIVAHVLSHSGTDGEAFSLTSFAPCKCQCSVINIHDLLRKNQYRKF